MTRDSDACVMCTGIEGIRNGSAPPCIAELPQSFVVLGDQQFYRGYCILLAKRHATELFLMPAADARALFDEMRLVAEAIAAVTHPWKLNYECLGNTVPHVHWHLFPRFATESDDLRRGPIWVRPESERKVELTGDDRRQLVRALRAEIARRIPDARIPRD
jgi:diadenosine tetraphosphate (Ap4A) HIT family hydrolase